MKTLDLSLIFQLSVSTHNMDEILANWRTYFHIHDDSVIRKSTKEIYDRGEYHCKNFLEQEVEFYHKYYRFDLAGLDMEVIEPITLDNSNPYTDFLAHGKNGLQHVGVRIVNRDDLVNNMKELGVPVYTYAYQGPEEPDMTKRADCYFYDLRPYLGMIFEAGGAVVGPLATDPRAGNQAVLGTLNSYAAKPELPERREVPGLEPMELNQFYQIAVCVGDADAVTQNWVDFFGLDETGVRRGGEEGLCKFCLLEAGGIEVKVIEPAGDGIYRDFLEQSGGNNIMYVAATVDAKNALVKNMAVLGVQPLAQMQGDTGDPTDADAILYDLRDLCGVILKV